MSRPAHAFTLAATLLLVPGAAGAEERAPEQRASISVEVGDTVYVGEVASLTLMIGYDEPWFEQHAAMLFRQPMDIPIRVLFPTLDPPGALRALPEGEAIFVLPSFALGDVVVRATGVGTATDYRLPGNPKHFALLDLTRRFAVAQPGEILLGAPMLEFAWAERFETDLLGVRTPVDPQRVTVTGTASRLTALPVPAEGRPPDYQGLIGRYTIAASADRSAVAAGEPLRLTLDLVGRGNHETLPVPGFQGLDGFHLLGTLDEQTPTLRTLRIDLVALDANTREIPALTLAFFDPERGAYDVVRSEPIPLTVHGAPVPVPAPPAPPEPAASRDWLLPLALGLLALVGVGLLLRRRGARTQDSTRPDGQLEALLARLHGAAGTPADGQALIDVLAWQLGVGPAAVVAPDLAVRLVRSGWPAALAERAGAAVEAGVAARYAGSHAVSEALPRELIADLETALRPPHAT